LSILRRLSIACWVLCAACAGSGPKVAARPDLLVARARARAALGEVDRWRDLDAAIAAGAAGLEPELRAALLEAAANRRWAGDATGARELEARAGAPAPPRDELGGWLRGETDAAPEDADAALAVAAAGAGLTAELARAEAARRAGRAADAVAALARARALPGGEDALARRGEWQALAGSAAPAMRRLRAILDGQGDLGRPGVRPASARPGCRPDPDGLAAVRAAVAAGDLDDAEGRARAYVDGDLALGCRVPEVFAAFFPSSPKRALPWARTLVAENPEAPGPWLLEARAEAALGRAPEALIALTHAEAFARPRGRASTTIAVELVAAGAPVAAVVAGRQAIALAEGDDGPAAYRALAAACRAAGRADDAERALAAAPADRRDPRALLLIGLAADGERGAHALAGYADLEDAAGRPDQARAARAEAAALGPFTPAERTARPAASARRTPGP
jgi:hypothetical protein